MSTILDGLTAAERAEFDAHVTGLKRRGWVEVDEFRSLRPGVRIRHRGEQYTEAYRDGTATVLIVTEKPNSPWARKYHHPDVELVALTDRDRFGTGIRLMFVADYHVEIVEVQP